MTDEGQTGTPMDMVELAHAMVGIAGATRAFYVALTEEGFDSAEAMTLTMTWLSATYGGSGTS